MTEMPDGASGDPTDDARIAAVRADDAPVRPGPPERSGMPIGPWAHVSGRFSPAQRSLIIGGVLLLASLVAFRLVTPSLVGYRSAKPDDCLAGSAAVAAAVKAGEVRTVSGVPATEVAGCDRPHAQEVMGQVELPGVGAPPARSTECRRRRERPARRCSRRTSVARSRTRPSA